jgi:hypothetical protein
MRDFIYRIWGIKEKKYVMTASLYEMNEFDFDKLGFEFVNKSTDI